MKKHGGSGTDIKTAFLNAPLDEREAEFLICNPPKVLYAAGIIPRGFKWRVHGALHGLQASPRAWSRKRDRTCRTLTRSASSWGSFGRQIQQESIVSSICMLLNTAFGLFLISGVLQPIEQW